MIYNLQQVPTAQLSIPHLFSMTGAKATIMCDKKNIFNVGDGFFDKFQPSGYYEIVSITNKRGSKGDWSKYEQGQPIVVECDVEYHDIGESEMIRVIETIKERI